MMWWAHPVQNNTQVDFFTGGGASRIYSYLSASMGSMREALRAG
jgi:hypothetical protein